VVATAPLLWRVHRAAGAHVLPWNALRRFGPLPSMRYDPQPPPPGESAEGVLYATTDPTTGLAEVFQVTRLIDTVSFQPHLTAWAPTRPLRLLDLTGAWALRNSAAHALAAAPRNTVRSWVRAIRAAWPDLDGLWTPSTLTGRPNVVLFNPAADGFPPAPAFSRPLGHPVVRAIVARAAADIGYRVL